MTSGVFPPAALERAPGGLLDVATVLEHPDSFGQWTNGQFSWDTFACPVDLVLSDFCTNQGDGTIASVSQDGVPASWPFGIITRSVCLTLGLKPDERKAIALKQNDIGTQKAVEYELWTGAISRATAAAGGARLQNRFLSDSLSVDVTPGTGAQSTYLGVAALEQALADCGLGAMGVIHMTRSVAALAFAHNLIAESDGILKTGLGTPVVAGVGYVASYPRQTAASSPTPMPGPHPVQAMPTDQWMYATGPVSVHLGPSEVMDDQPIIRISTNEIAVLAGRPAAVYWDSCCTFAAHVDLTK